MQNQEKFQKFFTLFANYDKIDIKEQDISLFLQLHIKKREKKR